MIDENIKNGDIVKAVLLGSNKSKSTTIIDGIVRIENSRIYILHNDANFVGSKPHDFEFSRKYSWWIGNSNSRGIHFNASYIHTLEVSGRKYNNPERLERIEEGMLVNAIIIDFEKPGRKKIRIKEGRIHIWGNIVYLMHNKKVPNGGHRAIRAKYGYRSSYAVGKISGGIVVWNNLFIYEIKVSTNNKYLKNEKKP